MKRIAVIVLILFSQCATAADSTFVNLMNSICKQVIDTSYRYYYVLDEARNPQFNRSKLDDIKFEESKIAAEVPLNDFLIATAADTSILKWSNHSLPKAKPVDRAHLPYCLGQLRIVHYLPINTKQSIIDSLESKNIMGVRVNPNSSRKQAKKQLDRAMAIYYKRPKEERNYYIISKPVFSIDKKFALISVDEVGQGVTYILKNQGGKWVIVYSSRWVA